MPFSVRLRRGLLSPADSDLHSDPPPAPRTPRLLARLRRPDRRSPRRLALQAAAPSRLLEQERAPRRPVPDAVEAPTLPRPTPDLAVIPDREPMRLVAHAHQKLQGGRPPRQAERLTPARKDDLFETLRQRDERHRLERRSRGRAARRFELPHAPVDHDQIRGRGVPLRDARGVAPTLRHAAKCPALTERMRKRGTRTERPPRGRTMEATTLVPNRFDRRRADGRGSEASPASAAGRGSSPPPRLQLLRAVPFSRARRRNARSAAPCARAPPRPRREGRGAGRGFGQLREERCALAVGVGHFGHDRGRDLAEPA